ILCGGEPLLSAPAAALIAQSGALWNMYGPTETTVWSTLAQIDQSARITVGRPIANTQIFLLDTQLQPVPIGVPGMLYIGGVGLARGYLNRADLTAEKFIPNPFQTLNDKRETINEALVNSNSAFSAQPSSLGGRLYRTGDL